MADEILLAHLETKRSFLTLPDERVLFAKRKHWFVLLLRICTTSALAVFLALTSFFAFFFLFPQPTVFIATALSLLVFTSGLITKLIIDWYCHLYIVTTRKILEVYLSPLFSDRINDILLDQVRCTEVDTERKGILRELLDIGDVIVTFDRPTHQQEFIFAGIKDSERAGIFLSDILVGQAHKQSVDAGIWFRDRVKEPKRPLRFTEEIFPGETIGAN